MELPKNITQIGEADQSCKVYVEDYVVSYMKQLNRAAMDKDMAVALYGIRKEEGDLTYLFLYGACKLDFLQRETRHLSQAQYQEIEKYRKNYFPDYDFQGYRLLNGEMIEGFHICEQGICRYIAGYAQFYEKNDSMLVYMLDAREQEAQPELVDQEKYETVKRRQEARKVQAEESKERKNRNGEERNRKIRTGEETERKTRAAEGRIRKPRAGENRSRRNYTEENQDKKGENAISHRERMADEGLSPEEREDLSAVWKQNDRKDGKAPVSRQTAGLRKMKAASVAVFALLCFVGYAAMSGKMEELQVAAKRVIAGVSEQKLPDSEGPDATQAMSSSTNVNTLIADDKLAQALQKENEKPEDTQPSEMTSPPDEGMVQPAEEGALQGEPSQGETVPSSLQTPDQAQEPENMPETGSEDAAAQAGSQSISYTIKQGDTLIGISWRNYGSGERVAEICALNEIADPNDIKVGQKILLPQ